MLSKDGGVRDSGGQATLGTVDTGDNESDRPGLEKAGERVGFWTDLNISRLKILWAEGYSATRISAEIGCTRNAVIGKLHRLKLPAPLVKKCLKDGTYTQQLTPEQRENRRLRVRRCRERARALKRQAYLQGQSEAIWLADNTEENRRQFLANGASPYSAAYRKHMQRAPELTKGELREMLKRAVQNTAAMQ